MALGDMGTDQYERGDEVKSSGKKRISDGERRRENFFENFHNLSAIFDPTSLTQGDCHAHQV